MKGAWIGNLRGPEGEGVWEVRRGEAKLRLERRFEKVMRERGGTVVAATSSVGRWVKVRGKK